MKKFWSLLVGACALIAASRPARADVNLNVYGDIDYLAERFHYADAPGVNDTYTNSFSVSRVTSFFTANMGRLSLVDENLFYIPFVNQGVSNFEVGIERFQITYTAADWLRITAGKFHTAIGYYNDAYHSAYYYQLAVDRPLFVSFEEAGGIIPARSIGIHADGRIQLGKPGALHYDVELANGRGNRLDQIVNASDPNGNKSFNLRLRYEPQFLEGLIIGGNVYYDTIAGGPTAIQLPTGESIPYTIPKMRELIWGAHAAYVEGNWNVIAEFAQVRHSLFDSPVAQTWVTNAGFVQAGYSFGVITPFVQFERLKIPDPTALTPGGGDPYFLTSIGGTMSRWLYMAGVKWQAMDGLALKLELTHVVLDHGLSVDALSSQAAVAF